MENLKNLEKIVKIFQPQNIITSEEIDQVLKGIMEILASYKKGTDAINEETKAVVNSLLEQTIKYNQETISEFKSEAEKAHAERMKELQGFLSEVKTTLGDMEIMMSEVKDGKDADEERVIDEVINRIKIDPTVVTMSAEEVRDKLASLKDDDRLDKSAIKGLEKVLQQKDLDYAIATLQHQASFLINKGGIKNVTAGTNVTIDYTDPSNPVISSTGGGSGSPGGSDTQVQFNDGGSFGGGAGLTYNKTTDSLTIGGNLTVDTNTLFVDATNNRVGIGTTSPSYELSVAGNIQLTTGGRVYGDTTSQSLLLSSTSGVILAYSTNSVRVGSSRTQLWAGGSEIQSVTTTGVGLLTTVPTHTLTLGSTSTGISLYNTADQTTNYERARAYWNGTVFTLTTENGGSGALRSLRLTGGMVQSFTLYNTTTAGQFAFAATSTATNGALHSSFTGTISASSGSQTIISITPTISQSSTAGYTALLVNPTETTTGSGSKLLADFQVGGSSKAKIDNTGLITAPQVINTPATITVTSNAGTVTRANRVNNFTNSSAATMTITMSTTSAADGDMVMVRIKDFSAAAQTITWVNTENSTVTAPTTSNGSTTLPLTVGFQYNSATSKWRCIASA